MRDVLSKRFSFLAFSMFWTLVDLFCAKRLFSQETASLPDYFTRDKNGRSSFTRKCDGKKWNSFQKELCIKIRDPITVLQIWTFSKIAN